jgi:hypothetical protein
MPQQYSLHHPQQQQQQQQQQYGTDPYTSNENGTSNMYSSPRQPVFNNYSQQPNYSTMQPQIQSQPPNNPSYNNTDMQHFYGPVS